MSARVAGIMAPLIRLLGQYHRAIPMAIFGSAPVVGGLLCVLLPETRGTDLVDDTGYSQPLAEVGTRRCPCCLLGRDVGCQRCGRLSALHGLGLGVSSRAYSGGRAGSRAAPLRTEGRRPHNPAHGGHPFVPVHGMEGLQEWPALRLPPPALPREGPVPRSHVLWLSASRSSQTPFPAGPGGIAPRYFCCPAGRRVSTGAQKVSGEWEARLLKAACPREGCHQLITGLYLLLNSFPFH